MEITNKILIGLVVFICIAPFFGITPMSIIAEIYISYQRSFIKNLRGKVIEKDPTAQILTQGYYEVDFLSKMNLSDIFELAEDVTGMTEGKITFKNRTGQCTQYFQIQLTNGNIYKFFVTVCANKSTSEGDYFRASVRRIR